MTVKQISYNISKRTQDVNYIVIHDTGNTGKGANAESHYNYFNSADRQSSADFFVDSDGVWQVNDYRKYCTWHCGDGKGKYGITNQNSIGIEMCINSDGDYDKAFDNTVKLTKSLMAQLNIDTDHVVRHFDASRKNCPASYNVNGWERWNVFKLELAETEDSIMIYNYIDDNMPEWARDSVQWAVDNGIVKGNENGLNLDDKDLKYICYLHRALILIK